MPEIKAMEKKIKKLWDTFYSLWSEVEDDEYLLMNYPHAQEVVEFMFNCELEYGGIEKIIFVISNRHIRKRNKRG